MNENQNCNQLEKHKETKRKKLTNTQTLKVRMYHRNKQLKRDGKLETKYERQNERGKQSKRDGNHFSCHL